jgi:hypothetical protein
MPLEHSLACEVELFLSQSDNPDDIFLKIDDDQDPHPNMLDMIPQMGEEHQVCGVPILTKKIGDCGRKGLVPLILYQTPEGRYQTLGEYEGPATWLACDAFGGGILFVTRRVLSQINAPFESLWDPITGKRIRGQDLYFCEKVRALGYQPWVHLAYPADHLKKIRYNDIGPGPFLDGR